eukprot:8062969-Pyramimonas_sp.AAC.2
MSVSPSSKDSRSTLSSRAGKARGNARRLIALGFLLRMARPTPRSDGASIRQKFAPLGCHQRAVTKVLDMAKKISLELGALIHVHNFATKSMAHGPFAIADSLAPSTPLSLCVEQNRGVTGRQLFSSTGRARSRPTRVFQDRQLPVSIDGLGGLVRALRAPEDLRAASSR